VILAPLLSRTGLARNHPFLDGNKRTAHVVYRTFLALNAPSSSLTAEEKYITMMALAEGKLTERDFAAWLRERVRASGGVKRTNRAPLTARSRATAPKRAWAEEASGLSGEASSGPYTIAAGDLGSNPPTDHLFLEGHAAP
jgi:hypothetical protein